MCLRLSSFSQELSTEDSEQHDRSRLGSVAGIVRVTLYFMQYKINTFLIYPATDKYILNWKTKDCNDNNYHYVYIYTHTYTQKLYNIMRVV